jgi:hypothetical protein
MPTSLFVDPGRSIVQSPQRVPRHHRSTECIRRVKPEGPERDPTIETPLCRICGKEMTYLAQIPAGLFRTAKSIFRCYACNLVVSVPATPQ